MKLIVRYQDKPRMIRLRNQWVQMDPRAWNANMDATVSVGLGSGSREKDAVFLAQIAAKQEMIIQRSGPMNPICNLAQYAITLRKMVEAGGIRNADQFFGEVDPQQFAQQMAQQQQQPDPKMQAEMAKMQLERQKAAAEVQLERQKSQDQIAAMREKHALELELAREKAAAEIELARQKADFEREQRRANALLDAELRRQEMAIEANLTAQANAERAARGETRFDTNIEQPGAV